MNDFVYDKFVHSSANLDTSIRSIMFELELELELGDRVVDGAYKGTVVDVLGSKRVKVLYDNKYGGMVIIVNNYFLSKLKSKRKFPTISNWK